MKVDKVNDREDFETFLTIMDDQLDALQDIAEEKGIKLDCSIEDCPKLETLFNVIALETEKSLLSNLIVLFARHLGEIVVRNYRGVWVLSLEDPNDIHYNTPVITGHSKEGVAFSPISVMRSFALRRKPGTLSTAINADININPLNLDDLVEQ